LLAGSPAGNAAEPGKRPGRPLPRFDGRSFDGERLDTTSLASRRALVYVFASTDTEANLFARLVQNLAPDASRANVRILGVNRDLNSDAGRRFLNTHGFEFPVIRDTDLSISRKLRARPGEPLLLLVDGGGWIVGGMSGLQGEVDDRVAYYERSLREALHIEKAGESLKPELGLSPKAPSFQLKGLDGEELSSAELDGVLVALVFFLPTCPHCHELLRFLEGLNAKLSGQPFRIVPVSLQNRPYVIRDMQRKLDITYASYVDPDKSVQEAFAFQASVPDTVLIDREGRVFSRHSGGGPRTQALLTMEIRQNLGLPNPILLDKNGYSGDANCRACHVSQHDTWSLTNHAYALETLAEHGAERNPECLVCHTVGFGEPGGYSVEKPLDYLAGVQCENCHGRGGSHQSPEFAKQGYEAICNTCHNPTHSLNFEYDERLPLVSHAANLQFASLSLEERQALLERRDKRQRKLFGSGDFVGSDACQSCHEPQYALWKQSPHAHALATLEQTGKHESADCVQCHTTGYEKTGGFPEGGAALASVGCESCHGPGAEHVQESTETTFKPGSILALTDKCDSCVILQICGSCHDEANDPGFEFELQEKLDRIRHGLRETAQAAP
jgi:peroxiredoxin